MRRISAFFAVGLLAASVSQVQAAVLSISVLEPSDAAPTPSTDIPGAVTSADFETASVVGSFSVAGTNGLTAGTTYVVLVEPTSDPFNQPISDIIRLTIGAVNTDNFQQVNLTFFSDSFPRFDSIIPPNVNPVQVTETGDPQVPQDITSALGLPTDGRILQVFASSDLASPEVPEPGALTLFCIGVLGIFGYGARTRMRAA
jgi:hypothetical protein